MFPRRIDSLFVRLLLAQVVLVTMALLVFAGLLLIERNQVLAPQFAEVWAPRIAKAARAVAADGSARPDPAIEHHADLPSTLRVRALRMPAIADFDAGLAGHGVEVDDAWIAWADSRFSLWLRVRVDGALPVWLSGELPAAVMPRWEPRMTVGVALLGLAIALVTRSLSRGVAGPLSLLRLRMQEHARSGTPPPSQDRIFLAGAPPELLAIEQAYLLLAERLQRNERERALLLAGVSHDLRSPLSRIRLAAEMLPETPDNAGGVASITRNVDHADRLTASFLEFVRASTVALNETVDLCAVARSAVAGFDRPAAELSVRAPPALLLQRAHGLLIERLIVNLVENALKHGGTPVEVEVVATTEHDEAATLVVSDAGPGLPPENAGKLTEAFARGDPSRSVPGFGLGLAIAQQIVVRLEGDLSFGRERARHRVSARIPTRR